VIGRKTTLTLLTGALLAVGTLGSGAAVWAASAKPTPGPGDEIHACAGKHGFLRLSVHYDCRPREFPISWNRQGPAGPPGPAGPSLNPTTLQSVQTGSPFAVPAGAGAAAPVPGLSVNLPQAGTYEINANVRGVIHYPAGPAHSCWITADLTNGATQVPNSLRLVVLDINGSTADEWAQATAPIQMLVTVAGPSTVNVRAFSASTANPSACPAGAGTGIYTDANGASTINAVRIQ
jgi:hypothetical protein